MTKSSKIASKMHQKAALLALSAGLPPPVGKRPDLLEIELWRRNKLSKKRSAEVKSYVARDADCYQLWQDLLTSEQQLNAEKQASRVSLWQRCQNWIIGDNKVWLGGGFAVATMALFVAVVGLKSFLNPGMMVGIGQDYEQFSSHPAASSWHYKSHDKGIGFAIPTPYDKAKTAISVGIHSGLVELQNAGKLSENEWQNIIQQYPAQLPDCPDAVETQQCQKQNAQLQDFGRWLALMQLDCGQTASVKDTQYYSLQQERLVYFSKEFVAYPVIAPLRERMHSLDKATDSKLFCQKIAMLLNHIDN